MDFLFRVELFLQKTGAGGCTCWLTAN